MKLSLRMETVKSTVVPCKTLCDVGCDHGFVSIALVEDGTAEKVIACDINKGPLAAASDNIKAAGLSDSIETRLSDGLHKVTKEDRPDAIVIAGMGGALTVKILTEGREVLKTVSQLVLQPQSELFLVRNWLRNEGYNISKECFLYDMGKPYFVIDARPGETTPHTDEENAFFDEFSEYLLKDKNPLYREYLKKGIENNETYLKGMPAEKRGELIKKTELMRKALLMTE